MNLNGSSHMMVGGFMRYMAPYFIVLFVLSGCVTFVKPTNADLKVLLTAEDFSQFKPDHEINLTRVKAQKLQVSDISLLTYEYQPGRGLYLSSEASVGPKGSGEEHATRSIRGIKTAAWFKGDDLEIEEQPIRDGLSGGTRFFLLRSNGKPIGNAYVTFDAQRAMSVMFSGVYFSDLDQFSDFIKPKLEALTYYSPPSTNS